ncbi:MAG: hypothetical protein GWN55_14855, partial [Phycisphaerae bacterium]|nr:hypothetical protein [Phycisphaerae bacterium]NIV02577.1 hypothetical protein [Phycisphaerae bacterium]NIW99656.1 hypothetical protein [Phycisphaerae bacterium]
MTTEDILRLRFRGYSSHEVSEKVGYSQRTVQGRLRDFINEAEDVGDLEGGLLEAASNYEVRDLVYGLLEVSKTI